VKQGDTAVVVRSSVVAPLAETFIRAHLESV
jgi:hypothetical protein